MAEYLDKDGLLYYDNLLKGKLNKKANTDSPALTGTPTAPTAEAGDASTNIATTAFVAAAVKKATENLSGKITRTVVDALPETGDESVIYLIAHDGDAGNNAYDEYIWIAASSKFEKIGTTDTDLSGYLKASDVTAITNTEIDNIVAGTETASA